MSHNTECHMNKKGPPIKATYDQTVRGGGSFLHERSSEELINNFQRMAFERMIKCVTARVLLAEIIFGNISYAIYGV